MRRAGAEGQNAPGTAQQSTATFPTTSGWKQNTAQDSCPPVSENLGKEHMKR